MVAMTTEHTAREEAERLVSMRERLTVADVESALLAHGRRWRPHATTAAWYLWRAADASKKK